MILARAVFQATVGKTQELVARFKAAMQPSDAADQLHILTDLSSPFDTVVVETVAERRAEWERRRIEMFARPVLGALNATTKGSEDS
jgi:hypothetical protein